MFQRKIESIQFLVHILKPNSNMIFFSKRQQLDKMLTTNIRYGYFENRKDSNCEYGTVSKEYDVW